MPGIELGTGDIAVHEADQDPFGVHGKTLEVKQ